VHPTNNERMVWHPGKFLNTLIPYVLPDAKGAQKTLTAAQQQKLYSLLWFEQWRDGIQHSRSVGPDGAEPDTTEKITLFIDNYCTVPQAVVGQRKVVWSEALAPRTVKRHNGTQYLLHGFRMMEKLAHTWFPRNDKKGPVLVLTDAQRTSIEDMHWFERWRADGEQRRLVAHMRKVVTKEQKIELLVKHYNYNLDGTPRCKPSWNDTIPVPHTVQRDGEGKVSYVWEFKPATFLDDLVDNWARNGRPGVTLTDAQKRELEQLPWVKDWLRSVFTARERKRILRDDSSDDEGSTPCSKRSKTSVGSSSTCASRVPSPTGAAAAWVHVQEEEPLFEH